MFRDSDELYSVPNRQPDRECLLDMSRCFLYTEWGMYGVPKWLFDLHLGCGLHKLL